MEGGGDSHPPGLDPFDPLSWKDHNKNTAI